MSKRLTTEKFIKKAEELHHGKYDYSETVYVTSRSKVKIICPKHGPFMQRASAHLLGNGCPKCMYEWTEEHRRNLQASVRKSIGMTRDEWIRRARGVHGDKYDYSQVVYENNRTLVKIVCPKHGVFMQNPDSHLRGCGCRECSYELPNRGGKPWTEEQREKLKATCFERYGAERYLDSVEGKAKIRKIKSNPEFRKKMSQIISLDEIQDKSKKTSMSRYGVEYPMQTKDVQARVYRTKRKNHTVSSSKSEIRMYAMLSERFGSDDVEHQYRDDVRYPFACDFYIHSLDLFIELNAHWSHGKHWFGDVTEDEAVLAEWVLKAENSSYYKCAVETWTVRDVKKREAAIKNHLNYLAFWKNDLSDFKEWLNQKPMVLNNI